MVEIWRKKRVDGEIYDGKMTNFEDWEYGFHIMKIKTAQTAVDIDRNDGIITITNLDRVTLCLCHKYSL